MHSLSWLFFASFTVLALISSHASSTSRILDQHKHPPHGFRLTLHHIDSGKNLTKFERLQRGIKRGNRKLQMLNNAILTSSSGSIDNGVEATVVPGTGEFLMTLAIGTPPESFSAILDTGSDLIWTQCKPCSQCFDQPTPIFDPRKSSTFNSISCSSELCSALPLWDCDPGCEYLYFYGDSSLTQGSLASETFTFGDVSVPSVAFGCGNDNEGDGFDQGSGLVGLGRGPLSLVSQLREPKFSYCLTSIDDSKESMPFMGSTASINATSSSGFMTTPLIRNPRQPSLYYLSLEGITVGATRLPINESAFALRHDGTGGMIIDSGTTLTYLEPEAFDAVSEAFVSAVSLPVDYSGSTGLDLCFSLPSGQTAIDTPRLIFHFTEADLELPAENYITVDSSLGVACLAMAMTSSSGMSVFGNVQQQNMLVLHDLDKETLSFLPTKCDQL